MNEPAMHRFVAAPLDRPTLLVSAAFVTALVGAAITVPAAVGGTTGIVVGVGFPAAIIVLAYGFSPDAYDIPGDGHLRVVRRLFGSRTFRVDTAAPMAELFGFGGIRIAGSGGAFGWYGLFWRKSTGRYRAYVTDRASLVACRGADGLVVVSPVDVAGFLDAVGREG